MRADPVWYRSEEPRAPTEAEKRAVKRSLVDIFDHPVVEVLARPFIEPRVRGKLMVMYDREGTTADTRWVGLFSEFHSVLGALVYARRRGALGVRVRYRSPFYLEPSRGPNWWEYYFERSTMLLDGAPAGPIPEVHLNRRLARYGRYFGFVRIVNGEWGHLYPMTTGRPRAELAELVAEHMPVRAELRARVDRFVRERFPRPGRVVGVHYRGTDSARHYPYHRVPYEAYMAEIRRIMGDDAEAALFVATDEADFLEYARDALGHDRVLYWAESPRVRPDERSIHFNDAVPAGPYVKGETAVIDCLLLAACDYLVKGRSNLSEASLLYNPTLAYSFCLG